MTTVRATTGRRARPGMPAVAIATFLAGWLAPGVGRADAAEPSDYRTEVVAVTPQVPGLEVTIEGGDSFVRVQAPRDSEVIVSGYEGEPYLWFSPDGTVFANRLSAATYLNERRTGRVELPDFVDPTAAADWNAVGDGGVWAWHDHRSHWMGHEPPEGLEPGDSLAIQTIPITVDGRSVSIEVQTTLVGGPSGFPAALGVLVGLVLVLAGLWLGPATATLTTLLVSIAAAIVGAGQYLSLPSETGPLLGWWALPAIAVVAGVAAIASYGRSPLLVHGLLALAGVQLAIWAFSRRMVLTKPVLPTDLPFWLDRTVTSAALVMGVVAAGTAVWELARFSSSEPTPRRSLR